MTMADNRDQPFWRKVFGRRRESWNYPNYPDPIMAKGRMENIEAFLRSLDAPQMKFMATHFGASGREIEEFLNNIVAYKELKWEGGGVLDGLHLPWGMPFYSFVTLRKHLWDTYPHGHDAACDLWVRDLLRQELKAFAELHAYFDLNVRVPNLPETIARLIKENETEARPTYRKLLERFRMVGVMSSAAAATTAQ